MRLTSFLRFCSNIGLRPKPARALGLACALLVASFAPPLVSTARACGGCFHAEPSVTETENVSVVTDHRMVLALSPTMTTLWDQVEYAGNPGDFAWVLPIRGAVTVGVGTDAFIAALDAQTAPVIDSPVTCAAPPSSGRSNGGCGGSGAAGCSSSADDGLGDFQVGYQEEAGVFITNREAVGPYATVQIHGDTEASIVGWLRDHHYVVPANIEPILAKYVSEGFDFLAVRLKPREGVQAMEPIRVSWLGATPSLPLRMVAAGVGDVVGLKLFVVGDGRWKTDNFPTFVVDPSTLSWDFAAQRSNYTSTRDAMAAKFDMRAFAMEASIDVLASTIPATSATPPDAGNQDDSAIDAPLDAADPGDALTDADDASSIDADLPTYDAGAAPDVDPYATDVSIAFGTYYQRRVTRLRADMPARYLDEDLFLTADSSQAVLPATLKVQASTNAPVCSQYPGCTVGESTPIRPWRVVGLGAGLFLGAILARRATRRS